MSYSLTTIDQPRFDPVHLSLTPGDSLYDIADMANIQPSYYRYVVFLVNGAVCEDWEYQTIAGDEIRIAVVPEGGGGGKKILSFLAVIAIGFFAPQIAAAIGPQMGITSSLGLKVLAAGISMVGSMLVQALIPPPSVANNFGNQARESQTFGISPSSNYPQPYGTVPVLYGKFLMSPMLCTSPDVDTTGKITRITECFTFGIGYVEARDVKIGGQPIENILNADDQIFNVYPYTKGEELKYATRNVAIDQPGLGLKHGTPTIVVTKTNTDHAIVSINFPRGLVKFNQSNGNREQTSITMAMRYRVINPNGTRGQWFPIFAAGYKGAQSVSNKNLTVWTSLPWVIKTTEIAIRNYTWSELVYVTLLVNGRRLFAKFVSQNEARSYASGTPITLSSGERYRVTGTGLGSYTHYTNSGLAYPMTSFQCQKEEDNSGTTLVQVQVNHTTAEPWSLSISLDFPEPAQYEIEARRYTSESTNQYLYNATEIGLVKSYQHSPPLNLKRHHTLAELAITANDRVNGIVTDLSAVAYRHIFDIDATGWIMDGADRASPIFSENPALIALDIITNPDANNRPLLDSQIDFAAFNRLKNICDQIITTNVNGKTESHHRYTFNGLIDVEMTVKEAVNTVLGNARSQLIINSAGQYSVMHDEEKTVPRQLFTPTNYKNFSGSMSYFDAPHALKISYVNDVTYTPTDVYVYAPGYNASNATKIEDLRTFGMTHYAEVVRYGYYMMAQARYRAETFTIEVSADNLVCQRGDLVLVTSDVAMTGGVSARIQDVSGGTITLDRDMVVPANAQYTVRTINGDIKTANVLSQVAGNQITITPDADIGPDDLIVIGLKDQVTQEYLVSAIEPTADLNATLVLQKYDKRLYDIADNSQIPDWDPDLGQLPDNQTNLSIGSLTTDYKIQIVNRLPNGNLSINWKVGGTVSIYDHSVITLVKPDGTRIVLGESSGFSYFIDFPLLDRQDLIGQGTIEVLPVDVLGNQGTVGQASVDIKGDETPPAPPASFGVNVVGNVSVVLFWEASPDADVIRYELRYSPDVTSTVWEAATHLAYAPWDADQIVVGARTGSYFIRAIDSSGNRSVALHKRTTLETLPDMNYIKRYDEALDDWPGNKVNLVDVGQALEMDDLTLLEASYTFDKMLDLGDIFDARISAKIFAHSEDQITFMSAWTTLSSVPQLTRTKDAYWNARLEVKTFEDATMMSDWVLLSVIDPIGGTGGFESDWRPVQVGNFQARLFMFRVLIETDDALTKVVLDNVSVEVDMEDRFEYLNDVFIPVNGKDVVFKYGFNVVPSVAVTVDGNDQALIANVASKTPYGCRVTLYDVQTNRRTAGFVDLQAHGYGRHIPRTI